MLLGEKQLWQDIFSRLRRDGKTVAPRGLKVLEVENFIYELPPYVRFPNFAPRKLSVDYIKREFLWYLRADQSDLSIGKYAAIWRNIIYDGKLMSNYGHFAFRERGLQWCYEELVRDKDSRRACFTILNNVHCHDKAKDVPCTAYLNFRIRDNKLNMSVHMRSQDAIYGMGNDAPAFSFFQEMLFTLLKFTYPELQMGSYFHTADSFHVYEQLGKLRGFELLEQICDPQVEFDSIDVPRMADISEIQYLVDYYPKGVKPSNVPGLMEFSNWLTAVEFNETSGEKETVAR